MFDNLIDEFVVVVGYKKRNERYEDEYCGVPISYAHQREQLGLVRKLLQQLDRFVLMFGGNDLRANFDDEICRQQEAARSMDFLTPSTCLSSPVALSTRSVWTAGGQRR